MPVQELALLLYTHHSLTLRTTAELLSAYLDRSEISEGI